MKIIRLKKADKQSLKQLNGLFTQLSPDKSPMSFSYFKKLIANRDVFLAVVLDGKTIVGMGTLITAMSVANKFGLIEDVIVNEKFQGKGLGKSLMQYLINEGSKQKLAKLKLTSKKERIVANILYKKLGFVLKETNVYRMKLEKRPL